MARIIWSWQCCRLLVGNIANGIASKNFFSFLTELGNFKQKHFWRQCHWQCCQTKVCSIVKTRWFGPLLAEIFSQIRRIANVEFYLLFARLQDAVFCSKYQPSTIWLGTYLNFFGIRHCGGRRQAIAATARYLATWFLVAYRRITPTPPRIVLLF